MPLANTGGAINLIICLNLYQNFSVLVVVIKTIIQVAITVQFNFMSEDRIDQIYRTLIDYIRDDNNDKNSIKKDLSELKSQTDRIELQTTKTNGRVTKLEGSVLVLENYDKTRVIVQKVNWKWLSLFGTIGLGILTIVMNLLVEWFKDKFFK